MACIPPDWRLALTRARDRGTPLLPESDLAALQSEHVRRNSVDADELTTRAVGGTLTSNEPVRDLQRRVAEIHKCFVHGLVARGQAAWVPLPPTVANGENGAVKAAESEVVDAAERDAEALADDVVSGRRWQREVLARRLHEQLRAMMVDLQARLQARVGQQATLQRYADLKESVDGRKRMVAALQAEVEQAKKALAIADAALALS
jgi:hypothetical protein